MDVIITSVQGISIFDIERDLVNGVLLGRRVRIIDSMMMSERNLTAELLDLDEMFKLRAEPRILQVERLEEMSERAILTPEITQAINPVFSSVSNSSHTNWGLQYCSNSESTYSYQYSHAGEGVDIVFMDSGLRPTHNEFKDANGVSRVQLIAWKPDQFTAKPNHYSDSDGHGTHVAAIGAGLTHGWAKKANIYSIKIFNTDAYDYLEAIQLLRLWHLSKTNGRPTVVNMSWGFTSNFPANYPDASLAGKPHPIRIASVDAEVEDLVEAGAIVVSSAGNDSAYVATPDDPAYNHYYYTNSSYSYLPSASGATYIYYYKRKTPAGAAGVICVGANGDSSVVLDKNKVAYFSNIGPRVDIFAPGYYIQSASNASDTGFAKRSGTSMASPQVAGIVSVYASMYPKANLTRINNMLASFGKQGVLNETALQGAANLVACSVFNGVRVKHQGQWRTAMPFLFFGNAVIQPNKLVCKNAAALKRVFG